MNRFVSQLVLNILQGKKEDSLILADVLQEIGGEQAKRFSVRLQTKPVHFHTLYNIIRQFADNKIRCEVSKVVKRVSKRPYAQLHKRNYRYSIQNNASLNLIKKTCIIELHVMRRCLEEILVGNS